MSHQYKILSREDQDLLLTTFLIDSWSFSKVSTFARHQAAFEMRYIFNLYGKSGPFTIAGKAYHQALQFFFAQLKEGEVVELPALEQTAFEHIAATPGNRWKLGKTTPTMEEAVQDALNDANKLLRNFFIEKDLYLDEIAEVLDVEVYFDEFLTVNGVDIPIPCHGAIDLVIYTKDGKRVIVDHKAKKSYTDDAEAAMVIGQQAITYTLGYEAKTGLTIDEVWFVENKPSQNKDKSPQVKIIASKMDENARRLYEALLYEPLRAMIGAVRDPDYTYLINTQDKLVDMAEIFDFWSRVRICEVEDFNVDDSKKELIAKRMKKIRDAGSAMVSPEIIKKFRENASKFIQYDLSITNMTPQEKIEHVLRTFGVQSKVAHTFEGYSSNTFLLEVGAGIRVDSIRKYRLDIANGLDVENVRISENLVKHEGKSYLSVEISKHRDKKLLFAPSARIGHKIPVGVDNYGRTIFWNIDNPSTPHVLVCGATGSGKSVWLQSAMSFAQPVVSEIIILDPKNEFGHMAGRNVDVLDDMEHIEWAIAKAVDEMNLRVKNKVSYFTLIVFDEFADALANARKKKNLGEGERTLEENLRLLAQKGRSAGFRIIAATQRASSKIITGDTKVNFPVQICFRVPKEADSRVVLDEGGAECLAGQGDGLIKSPDYMDTVRFQAYFTPQNVTA